MFPLKGIFKTDSAAISKSLKMAISEIFDPNNDIRSCRTLNNVSH